MSCVGTVVQLMSTTGVLFVFSSSLDESPPEEGGGSSDETTSDESAATGANVDETNTSKSSMAQPVRLPNQGRVFTSGHQ